MIFSVFHLVCDQFIARLWYQLSLSQIKPSMNGSRSRTDFRFILKMVSWSTAFIGRLTQGFITTNSKLCPETWIESLLDIEITKSKVLPFAWISETEMAQDIKTSYNLWIIWILNEYLNTLANLAESTC